MNEPVLHIDLNSLSPPAGREDMYDWEVRETLEAWAGDVIAGSTAIGRATGEHRGFRGPGFAFRDNRPNDQRLACALVAGKPKGLA